MKLIKPSFEILEQLPGLEGMYKQIELAGRTCYKSDDKITEDSAKEFVDRMIKSGHGAMLEHGTVYLTIPCFNDCSTNDVVSHYINNKYSVIKDNSGIIKNIHDFDRKAYVTTNLRVLVENDWMEDLQYICEPTVHHEKRHTVKFICDRGVSHEFVRHKMLCVA